MSDYKKPLPVMEGITGAFYDWCRKEDLHFQQCDECGTFRHVPREMCAKCNSLEWTWERSTGKGTLYTWVVINRALHPAFGDEGVFANVVVDMAEGVRLMSTIIDCPPENFEFGMPLEVTYETVTDDITLPRFKRAD